MTAIPVQAATSGGLSLTFTAAAAGGDTVANNGRTYVRFKNGHVSNLTITAVAVYGCSHGFLHSAVVVVPAGGERDMGPFSVSQFGDPVSFTYSGVTLLTVAAVAL
jgi:hypothetical protein